MNSMMMDPELMRIAQEQMTRMSPQDLARIQQEMMSNPHMMKIATESMKNMRPEDFRVAAEQLKHTRPEDLAQIGEKMAKASPEELESLRVQAEAQVTYKLSAAQRLKQQGNQFHGHGNFRDASNKYLHAKENLKDVPFSKCKTLQLQCSLNLMSCYLKTNQFEECIKEGCEVLAYDPRNVKALYRRGQAYKEIGNLKAAVSDLTGAHNISPEDETIADVMRDAIEKLDKKGSRTVSGGLIIEEIVEEPFAPEITRCSSSASAPTDVGGNFQSGHLPKNEAPVADPVCQQGLKDNPEAIRLFQNYVSNAKPESLSAMGASGISPDMMKMVTDMISTMKPDELQKMLQVAPSLRGKDLATSDTGIGSGLEFGPEFPEMTPEMINLASERIKGMSTEELQKMAEIASSMSMNNQPSSTASSNSSRKRTQENHPSLFTTEKSSAGTFSEQNTQNHALFPKAGSSSSKPSTSAADLQETMRSSMRDPAMREMFMSMMKNMSPEMMANMSEQFGVKLSKDDAAKAQQAMASLSPDDLERMIPGLVFDEGNAMPVFVVSMRWTEKAQKAVETAKKAKNWLLGKPGLILAVCMLLLAFIFHNLGYIGC